MYIHLCGVCERFLCCIATTTTSRQIFKFHARMQRRRRLHTHTLPTCTRTKCRFISYTRPAHTNTYTQICRCVCVMSECVRLVQKYIFKYFATRARASPVQIPYGFGRLFCGERSACVMRAHSSKPPECCGRTLRTLSYAMPYANAGALRIMLAALVSACGGYFVYYVYLQMCFARGHTQIRIRHNM